MDQSTTGLILRTRPLTETSLIVQWLTLDFGRLSTVAKGARRLKSPFLGKLDQFYLADFSFHLSRRSDLHTLREVKVREYHPSLRRELGYLSQAAYFAQLLELTTEMNTPLPGLFQALADVLLALPMLPPQPLTVFAFEMKLLVELGFKPEFANSGLSLGARAILEQVTGADWSFVCRMKITSQQTGEIGSFLQDFLLYHFGKVPRGRAGAIPH